MTETISTLCSFSRIQIVKQKHVDKINAQQYECLKKLQNVLLSFSISNFIMYYARSCKICYLIIRSGYLPLSLYTTKYMCPESLILYSNKYFCKHYIIASKEKRESSNFLGIFLFCSISIFMDIIC